MHNYHYLIIGGGMTADSAAKGIRSIDKKSTIGILSSNENRIYNRPPLSKALWKGDSIDSIWRPTEQYEVSFHARTKATEIDLKKKQVKDDSGEIYFYQKLLLATGGEVRKLPYPVEGIIYYRTVDDYYSLKKLTETKNHFVIIGGGFIGSEVAAALAMSGKKVTMVFPENSLGERVYPKSLSTFLNDYYKEKGVEILNGENVSSIEKKGEEYFIKTKSGKEIKSDGVIAGLGISPAVELAKQAGLENDNGIIVNEFLQTKDENAFAAGDVANFYSPELGKRRRVEHEDNANAMGEMAGRNMAGAKEKYHYLPFFYSDLFDLGYEAVGDLDSKLETVEDWKEPFREGVIYYLLDDKIRGVLLWNTWGQLDNARELIKSGKVYSREKLRNLLPK
jgi:3-phenylpropionate/trans-cinnamate dioxygenase ferredoxin reductase component